MRVAHGTSRWFAMALRAWLALLLAPGPSNASEAGAGPILLSRQTLEQKSESATGYLRSNLGQQRFETLSSLLKSTFDGYAPVEACKGSFIAPGEMDMGLALVDRNFTNVIYAVAHRGGTDERITPVAKFKLPGDADKGNPNRVPAIACQAWTELARTKSTYQRLSASSASYSDLRLITHLDTLCVVPMDSGMEFSCFSFSERKKGFVGVGGWFND